MHGVCAGVGTVRPVARCGTPSGANRHRRLGEPVCDACREAKRAASREYARQPREPKPPADVAWKGRYAPGAVVIEGGHWVRKGLVLVPVGPRPVDERPVYDGLFRDPRSEGGSAA